MLLVLLAPATARADIADVFRQYDQGSLGDRNFVKTLLVGVADGLDAANDRLKQDGKPPLYCSPNGLKLTGDQLVEMLRAWIDQYRERTPQIVKAPPASALLVALEDAFPCAK